MTIGEKIKDLRKKNNITQEKLARYLNISCQAVSKWESNTAMPDISYVVPIANFFGVSNDTLFGLDSNIYSEEEKNLEDKYISLREQQKYTDALELMKAACSKFPRNYRLIYNQAEAFKLYAYENGKEDLLNNSISLCERILEDCTDNEIRYLTIQLMVYTYCRLNQKDKAKSLVDQLPGTPICKDLLLEHILTGDELEAQLDSNLEHFLLYIWLKLQRTAIPKDKRTVDDKIHGQRAAIKLYELIYYDGNFGCFSCRIAENYIALTKIYAGIKDTDNTLDSLSKAVKYAKAYADSFKQDVYTESIFLYNKKVSTDYLAEERKDSLFDRIRNLINAERLEFLKGNEKFEYIKKELEMI